MPGKDRKRVVIVGWSTDNTLANQYLGPASTIVLIKSAMRIEFDNVQPPGQSQNELRHIIRSLFAPDASSQASNSNSEPMALREVQVTRLLQGGYGGADVFEIELVYPSHKYLQVLKVGAADEMSREYEAFNSIPKDSLNTFFTPIRRHTAGVTDPSKRVSGRREALIYAHVKEWTAGSRLATFEDLAINAVTLGGDHLQVAIDSLRKLFHGVRSALHGASTYPSQTTDLRDYWNTQIGHVGEIETDGNVVRDGSSVHLNNLAAIYTPSALFPDDFQAADTWKNGNVSIGTLVTISELTAVWDGDNLVGKYTEPGHPHFTVVVKPREGAALLGMQEALPNGTVFSVTGSLRHIRNEIRRKEIEKQLELEFKHESLTGKGATIPDPFLHLQNILEARREDLPLSRVHGDLNGRNILIVDGQPCLIDYRHAATGQPILADFCWLEVTLARRILPRNMAWEEHVLLQRSLAATCRIGESGLDTFAKLLAVRSPEVERAFQLFAAIRLCSRDAYPAKDAPRWNADYVSQLAVLAHITLKWAPEHSGETRAAVAIAGVATESTSPQLAHKHWSDRDLETLGKSIVQHPHPELTASLFDLVATSYSLERFRVAVDDALFQAFVALRSTYIRSNELFQKQAGEIRDRVEKADRAYVALNASVERGRGVSAIPNASNIPYDEFIQKGALLNSLGQKGKEVQGTKAIDLLALCHQSVVLGDAGSGKTTLVEEWQFLLSESIRKEVGPIPRLPIMLNLTEALDRMGDNVWDTPTDTASVLQCTDPDHLRIGAVYLIVDGLNEVSVDTRAVVVAWLEALRRHFPLLPIVVCHRRYNYPPRLLPSFHVIQLQKLTPEQTKAFAQQYFAIQSAAGADGLADTLIHELTSNPDLQSIQDLAENPMFLWMLMVQFNRDGHLRESRGALFMDFTKWYLNDRRRDSGDEWKLPYDRKVSFLEMLAYDLVEEQRTELPTSRIEFVAAGEFPDWSALLTEIAESQMLFEQRGIHRFLHQSFQEYFAARYFLKRYATDPQELSRKILRHNWWDTFVILLGFTDSSSDVVLAIIQESLEKDPLLTARLLLVCEGINANVVKAFTSEQEAILSDNNAPSHLHEVSASALAEYGKGPARSVLFGLVSDVSVRETVRRTILSKLVKIAKQPRFKHEKLDLRVRLRECLENIIQDELHTELRVLAVRCVAILKLPEMGAILSAILNNSPRPVRLAAWEVCRELGITLTASQDQNFQQLCLEMLSEADNELRHTHEPGDIARLNRDRIGILKALATPEHVAVLLQHRFGLGILDDVNNILHELIKSDVQSVESEREAWLILRHDSVNLSDDVSEWLVAFRSTNDLVAAAGAHRLCAVAEEIPTHELKQLLDGGSSYDRIAAAAAIIDSSGNRELDDALETFLASQLSVIKGHDRVSSFALVALAFVRLAGRRGHRFLARAISYLFDNSGTASALYPLRIMHDRVFLQPDDYEILLAGDHDSVKAGIYNLQRGCSELMTCSVNRSPTRLTETALASLVSAVKQETEARWQGFSARAICECEATVLLPWLVEMAQKRQLADREVEWYLPDIGQFTELHRANIIRSIGYMSRIAMDRGDWADAETATEFLRRLETEMIPGTDSRIVNSVATALAFLGEWQPIFNALRPGEPWMFTAASNLFRHWIQEPPGGVRQRYEAALWIARHLQGKSDLDPEVASALLDVKSDIEKSLGHVIDVDKNGVPPVRLTDIRANDSRRIRLEDTERQLRKAIETAPGNARAYGDYSLFLKNSRKDFDGAEANYRTALELDPSQSNIAANFAFFLASVRNNTDEALTLYTRVLSEDTENALWIGNYAVFLENNVRDPDGALVHFKRALHLAPDDANLCANYAAFLIWQKRTEEAKQFLTTAWRTRHEAGQRSVAKSTFLLALIATLRHEDPREAMARLKSVLEGDFTTHPWPLTCLREWMNMQLEEEQVAYFIAICDAISDERLVDGLTEFSQWRRILSINWRRRWAEIDSFSAPADDAA